MLPPTAALCHLSRHVYLCCCASLLAAAQCPSAAVDSALRLVGFAQVPVVNVLKATSAILAGLMAAAMVAAMIAAQPATPDSFKSELVSYQKVTGQRTTMLDHLDPGEGADGEYPDQEPTSKNGYECCWKAPNPLLASTTVASKVGPNGWGEKPDADGSVDHYSNTLGEVPEWVFTGSGDHDWKDYDTVQNQEWYENTYPSGESGM